MIILITGSPGVGKTTIGQLLKENGHGFIDIDRTKNLKYWFNVKTGERVDFQGEKDLAWYDSHDLNWDLNVLKKLLAEQKEEIIFVAGVTSNVTENLDLFDKLFLLKTNLDTLRERRIERRGMDFEADMAVIEQGFEHHNAFQNEMVKHGAMAVDANKSPTIIVREILSNLDKYEPKT